MPEIVVPPLPVLAERIGVALDRWPGNCYAVAAACVDSGGIPGEAQYGAYYGPVSTKSIFNAHQGYIRHGWVRLADGRIFDPLRWEFEGVAPYVYITPGQSKEYDLGGDVLRGAMQGACPPVDMAKAEFSLPKGKLLWWMLAQIPNAMETATTRVDPGVAFWFANLPRSVLGSRAKGVYRWVAGLTDYSKSMIPIDNWQEVMG